MGGPFVEHTIEIERKWASKIITLSVDGEKFIEASSEDIDCAKDHWECRFRFVGEKSIDFDVYEENRDGESLDAKTVVSKKTPFTRECVVCIYDESNLGDA